MTRTTLSNLTWIISILGILAATFLKSTWIQILSPIHSIWLDLVIAFCLSTGIASTYFMQSSRSRHEGDRTTITFGILLVSVCLFSSIFSPDSNKSILSTAELGLSLWLLWRTARNRWDSKTQLLQDLSWLFYLISTSQLVALVLFFAFKVENIFGPYFRFQGYVDATLSGTVSALGLTVGLAVLSVREKIRPHRLVIDLTLLATCSITIFLSDSRGAIFAALSGTIATIIYCVRNRKFKRIFSLAGVFVLGYPLAIWFRSVALSLARADASPESVNNNFAKVDSPLNGYAGTDLLGSSLRSENTDVTSGRINIWLNLLEEWKESPFFGRGYRSSAALGAHWEAHNVYVAYLVETGLFGLAAFLLFLGRIFWLSRFNYLFGPVLTILVIGFSESVLIGLGGFGAFVEWGIIFAYYAQGRRAIEYEPGLNMKNFPKKDDTR